MLMQGPTWNTLWFPASGSMTAVGRTHGAKAGHCCWLAKQWGSFRSCWSLKSISQLHTHTCVFSTRVKVDWSKFIYCICICLYIYYICIYIYISYICLSQDHLQRQVGDPGNESGSPRSTDWRSLQTSHGRGKTMENTQGQIGQSTIHH